MKIESVKREVHGVERSFEVVFDVGSMPDHMFAYASGSKGGRLRTLGGAILIIDVTPTSKR